MKPIYYGGNFMEKCTQKISIKGRIYEVPSLLVGGAQVIASGRFPRMAFIHDEEWLEQASLPDPVNVLEALKTGYLKADIFSFTERLPVSKPNYPYLYEMDNDAVIPINSYKEWWDKLSQESRRNVRLAGKMGVTIKVIPFDDELVRGIIAIYNEAPLRLGKQFWHYGKDFETVKSENGTYAERSDYIGAFHEGKLIGFVKMVYVDRIGSIMQILSMIQHQKKRTTNALLAKAVEVCEARGMSYLKYCSYVYGTNESSLLTEFKRRNGFVKMDIPRYYIPLTFRGNLALKVRAHHGIKGMLPPDMLRFALQLRAKYYSLRKQDSLGDAECGNS
jgi:hypothetical protein